MAQYVPNGELYLCSGIVLDVSYNHTFSKNFFGTQTAQQNFFKGKAVKTYNGMSYVSKNGAYVDVPDTANALQNVTYMCWKTTDIPLTNDNDTPEYVDNKWYYAFVTKVDYLTPNTARVFFTLDVMQTYLFDLVWQDSYIQRRHCKRYNNGQPEINIEDEGLDYGDCYQIVSRDVVEPWTTDGIDVAWLCVATTKSLTGEGAYSPTRYTSGVPLAYYYFYVPICTDRNSNFTDNSRHICTAWDLLDKLATSTTFVNSVVSITITPFVPADVSFSVSGSDIKITVKNGLELMIADDFGYIYMKSVIGDPPDPLTFSIDKYSDFPKYAESKLLMYPYSFAELTTEHGQAMPIKLEFINGTTIPIKIFSNGSAINKIAYVVQNYLTSVNNGVFFENGIIDNTQANVPVINDNTATYLQSNKNSLQVASSNADRSMTVAYQNAEAGYMTALQTAKNTHVAQTVQTATNALIGGGSGLGKLAGGDIAGGLVSLLGAGASAYASIYGSNTQLENAGLQAQTQYNIQTASASVSNQNTQASIMAKFRDAQAIPPTVATMGNEYLFNNIYDCNKCYIIKKTIVPEMAERLTDYFKLYGYAYNRIETPNFHTRQSWDYLQIAVPNFYGNMPMNDKMKIMDIFMKGITFWHGDYIGDYSRSNNEI